MKEPLFCIMGPSGSGKTTLTDCLQKHFGFKSVASYTTRKPRYQGEVGHTFVSDEEFKALDTITTTDFDGYKYGVTADMLDRADLFVVDKEGIKTLKKHYNTRKVVIVALKCPNNILKQRMLSRGDSEEQVNKRITHDNGAFDGYMTLADYVIETNDDLNKIIQKFFEIYISSGTTKQLPERYFEKNEEYSKFVINNLTAGVRCMRCKKPVLFSYVDTYEYQCLEHDEDLYSIETYKGKKATPDELIDLIENVKTYLED